jgi:hypothetical protein
VPQTSHNPHELTRLVPRTVGHALVLAGTIHTLLGVVTFSGRSKSYYLAYGGALVSWGIVVVRPALSPPAVAV